MRLTTSKCKTCLFRNSVVASNNLESPRNKNGYEISTLLLEVKGMSPMISDYEKRRDRIVQNALVGAPEVKERR